jgi:hypothetical protein
VPTPQHLSTWLDADDRSTTAYPLPVSAQIPIKNDPKANDAVTAKVVADKLREVKAGHDGT